MTTQPVVDGQTEEAGDLEHRPTATAQTVEEALTALRDPARADSRDVHDSYLNAVLDHGAAIRDRAHRHIDAELAVQGIDDAAVAAEARAVSDELDEIEAEWREAKRRTNGGLTADRLSFVSTAAAEAVDNAMSTYLAKKKELLTRAVKRSNDINEQRARITREAYYQELARERSFGGAVFTPENTAKMTRADRALFISTTALYPDEMVSRAASLGPMIAKRSKARAHYNSAAAQRIRRTRYQVFDLGDALRRGQLRFSSYVDSPEDLAQGSGHPRDQQHTETTVVPRTPDNERRVGELVAQWNEGRRKPAVTQYATRTPRDGGVPFEVMYVKGPHKSARTSIAGVTAEVTYRDPSSLTHELGHRMEDRNPEISVATKAFLRRRTKGLAYQRYYRSEMVREDSFADAYMGKDYPGRHHTELFSCGMEAVTHGRFGGLRGQAPVAVNLSEGFDTRIAVHRADPEHLALVLGLLATANNAAPRPT